jgi:solute carrier family 29 (equilibrative nucleoside transporter), member 1/2/3
MFDEEVIFQVEEPQTPLAPYQSEDGDDVRKVEGLAPEDEGNLVYYCFLYLGFCALLPWSCILNSFDFMTLKMEGYSPTSTYPFANNMLVVASQVWIMTTGDLFTYSGRLITGFTALAVMCAAMPYLIVLPLGLNYWVVFTLLIIYGGFSGIAQGTVYTMAANLPFKYMGAVMFGNGLCGIAMNALRGLTLIAFPVTAGVDSDKNQFYSAVVFLTLGGFLLFMCVLLQFFVLRKNPYYIYYLDWIAAEKQRVIFDEADEMNDYGMKVNTTNSQDA